MLQDMMTTKRNNAFCMIWLQLEDIEWLQTLLDLEDMGYHDKVLQQNLKYKTHLETDKRALFLQHLQYQN